MKQQEDFFSLRARNASEQTFKILEKLPSFCFDFFIYIENTTTPLTRLAYANDLKIFFDFVSSYIFSCNSKEITLENFKIISSTQIETYLSKIGSYTNAQKNIKNGLSAKSRKLSSIRALYNFLFQKNLILTNESLKVKMPKIRTKEIIRLESDEVAAFLNTIEYGDGLTAKQREFHKKTCVRDLAIATLLLGTGIRISECVGLNIQDIDFNNNAFLIQRKGGNKAVLYFSEEVKQALKNWIEYRSILKINEEEKALFISLQNNRISAKTLQNLIKKFSKIICPLKNISPHKLRSTFGTQLYRETNDIYIVADILGHKDVNTTKKHYAAISEDLRKNATNKVNLRK